MNIKEKVSQAQVPLSTIYFHKSIMLSWRFPTLKEYNGHKELIYWQDNERSLCVDTEDPYIEETLCQVSLLPLWAHRTYRDVSVNKDELIFLRDDMGDIIIPKLWTESDLTNLLGVPCIMTTLTELEYGSEKIEVHF